MINATNQAQNNRYTGGGAPAANATGAGAGRSGEPAPTSTGGGLPQDTVSISSEAKATAKPTKPTLGGKKPKPVSPKPAFGPLIKWISGR